MDYAHVNKGFEGYGNLIIDTAGKYDVTFRADKIYGKDIIKG